MLDGFFGASFSPWWTACYAVVVAVFCLFGLHRYWILHLYRKHRGASAAPARRFAEPPRVTVQLPLFNERCVVERLLRAVGELDWPADQLEVQVLDDSTDETRELSARGVAALRARGIDAKLLLRPDRVGFKAGALEFGQRQATGEFILILDADFVPGRDLLRKTVDYFTDEKVGMVQTRWGHLNRRDSWLTRAQSIFLDGHLLLEQTARSRSGRFFNFNGTAGLWRKSAIEQAGGWQHDTLTEDLDLSYRAQLAGWKFLFLPDVETPAELPPDMPAFKSQQHRWTKGSIQVCRKLLPRIWRAPLPWTLKLEAFVHLGSNFAFLSLVCLCLLLDPLAGGGSGWERLVFLDLPVFIAASLSVAVFYVAAQRALYPQTWKRDMLWLPLALAVGMGLAVNNAKAVLEALFGIESGFVRTPKRGDGPPSAADAAATKISSRRYRAAAMWLVPALELAFAVHFARLLWISWEHAVWGGVIFLALLTGGFLTVALTSLWPQVAGWLAELRRPAPAAA